MIPIMPLLLLQSGSVEPARAPDPAVPVTVVRVAAGARPVLDGRLDEPAWATTTPITQLLQRDPNEGASATEATEVRVLYDADALYIGARLFDSAPRDIIARHGGAATSTPTGPAPKFALYNPDFRTRSLSVKAVWRWEYRPGSTVFFAWTHSRYNYFPYDTSFDVARDFGRELFLDRPRNVLLVKFNYWLSL